MRIIPEISACMVSLNIGLALVTSLVAFGYEFDLLECILAAAIFAALLYVAAHITGCAWRGVRHSRREGRR